MRTDVKSFKDLCNKTKVKTIEQLQRRFEHTPVLVLDSLNHFVEDSTIREDCLCDGGVLVMFKMKNSDQYFLLSNGVEITDVYGNGDGSHRIVEKIFYLKAISEIINNEEVEKELNQIVKDSKKTFPIDRIDYYAINDIMDSLRYGNFEPLNDDKEIYYKIIKNESLTTDEQKSLIYLAYKTIYDAFENLYNTDKIKFIQAVTFLLNHYKFVLHIYEQCSERAIRRKYDEINGDKKDQSVLHRAITTIRNTAATNSVELVNLFDKEYNAAHSKLKSAFSRRKQDFINKLMEQYLQIYVLTKMGFKIKKNGNGSERLKLCDIVEAKLKYNPTDDEYNKKVTYCIEHMFDWFDNYINVILGKIKYGLPLKNEIPSIIADIEMLNLISKTRYIYLAIYLMILDNFEITCTGDIVGYKNLEHKTSLILEKTIREIPVYVIFDYSQCMADGRQYLKTIVNDPEYFTIQNLYNKLILINTEIYKTPSFQEASLFTCKHKEELIRIVLASVQPYVTYEPDKLTDEFWYDEYSKILKNIHHYNVDHIFTKKQCENNNLDNVTTNCIGNKRLLLENINKSENKADTVRFVNENDYSYCQSVRGKIFTSDFISENHKYKIELFKKCPIFSRYNGTL